MPNRTSSPRTRGLAAAATLLVLVVVYLWVREVDPLLAPIDRAANQFVESGAPTDDLASEARPATEARTPLVAMAPGALLTGTATGTLKGRVLDELDAGVEGTNVRLLSGSSQRSARSDATGAYRFDEVPVGTSFVRLERGELTAGFVFDSARAPSDATTFRGHRIKVEPGEVALYDIYLVHAAQLEGRVVDRDGAPIEGVPVRLMADSAFNSKYGRTDKLGRFVIQSIAPSSYVLQVRLDPEPDSTQRAESAVPFVVELAPGEQRYLTDIVVGGGGHVLVGRVVDREGAPVEGVPIEVVATLEPDREHTWRAQTDKDGRYQAGRVPASSAAIRVPASEWEAPPGERRLVSAVPSVELDLRTESEQVEVPTFVVEPARPFNLAVRLVSTAKWRRSFGQGQFQMKYAATSVPTSVLASEDSAPRPYDDVERNDSAGDAAAVVWRYGDTFRYTCELPQEPFELSITFVLADDSTIVRSLRVEPIQDGFVETELHFP